MASVSGDTHEATQKTAEPVDHHEAKNPIDAPAADRISPEDHREEQDTSLQWVDSNGEPLKVGQEYEMDSPGWTIPDIIKVRQVKPDGISVIIQSEQGLDASTEIDKHEMELEQYTFTPSDATSVDEPIEDNIGNPDDPRQLPAAGSEQSDLSEPHFMMTHNKQSIAVHQCPHCGSKETPVTIPSQNEPVCPTCGYGASEIARYTPEELSGNSNSDFVQGPGYGINHDRYGHKQATPDSLSPRCPKCNSGTTGIASEDGDIQCHACGNVFSAPILKDPKVSKMFLHQCPAGHPFGSRHRTASNLQCPECGSALDPVTGLGEGVEERAFPQQDHPNPSAFTSEDPAISPQQQTTPIQPQAHTAGAKYTPMEQREFINESGTARNRDKLQLEGTHYAEVEEDDNFLFGW
jgi:hypothetical protein